MIFQKILLELKHSQNPKLFVNLNLKPAQSFFFFKFKYDLQRKIVTLNILPAQSCFVSHKHKILYKF